MKINLKKINVSNFNRSSSFYTKDSSSINRNIENDIEDLLSNRKNNYYSLREYNNNNNNDTKKTLFQQYNSNNCIKKKKIKKKFSTSLISFNKNKNQTKSILELNNNLLKNKSNSDIDIIKQKNILQIDLLTAKENVTKPKRKYRKLNYSLNELIKFDPYHLLNKGVKDYLNIYIKKNENYKFPNIGKKNIITSNGNQLKVLNSLSLLIKENKNKIQLIKKLMKMKNEISNELKDIIKWEGIYHLNQKHSIIINNLLFKFYDFKYFINKNENITFDDLNEFLNIIINVNLVKNTFYCFLEDILYLFSEDKTTVNLKKLYSILIITNNNLLYKEKINFLCNIWEIFDTNEINIRSLFYYIKNGFKIKSDYQKIYFYIKKKYKLNSNISKDIINSLFNYDNKILFYFERNCIINFKKINQKYNELLSQGILNNLNSLGLNMFNPDNYKIFCSKDIEHFENFLINIENKLDIKENLKTIFKE